MPPPKPQARKASSAAKDAASAPSSSSITCPGPLQQQQQPGERGGGGRGRGDRVSSGHRYNHMHVCRTHACGLTCHPPHPPTKGAAPPPSPPECVEEAAALLAVRAAHALQRHRFGHRLAGAIHGACGSSGSEFCSVQGDQSGGIRGGIGNTHPQLHPATHSSMAQNSPEQPAAALNRSSGRAPPPAPHPRCPSTR